MLSAHVAVAVAAVGEQERKPPARARAAPRDALDGVAAARDLRRERLGLAAQLEALRRRRLGRRRAERRERVLLLLLLARGPVWMVARAAKAVPFDKVCGHHGRRVLWKLEDARRRRKARDEGAAGRLAARGQLRQHHAAGGAGGAGEAQLSRARADAEVVVVCIFLRMYYVHE